MVQHRELTLPSAAFDERCSLMRDVTWHTLRGDPDLRLCEGLRLIEATRRAVARLAPHSLDILEARVLPELRRALMRRFGLPEDALKTH